jgi:hypothetical protein
VGKGWPSPISGTAQASFLLAAENNLLIDHRLSSDALLDHAADLGL